MDEKKTFYNYYSKYLYFIYDDPHILAQIGMGKYMLISLARQNRYDSVIYLTDKDENKFKKLLDSNVYRMSKLTVNEFLDRTKNYFLIYG